MDALDILTLKSFILTLRQLPTITPELQIALQAIPSDPQKMLEAIEDLTTQAPLAQTYLESQALFQARAGVRSKSDSMSLPGDDEPMDEIENTLVAIESQSDEDILKKLPEIIQSPNPQQAVLYWLGA